MTHPHPPSRPLLVGLVGGIASGKSTVSRFLERRGARVIDADALAKGLLDLPEVRRAVAAAFGDVETGGRIDHAKLARIAFSTPENATRLNTLVHPFVSRAIDRSVDTWTAEGFRGVVVVDAALLLEAGMRDRVEELIFVKAPEAARRARAAERGWEAKEIDRREGLQMPLAEKERQATVVLDNSGTEAELEAKVEELLRKWNR